MIVGYARVSTKDQNEARQMDYLTLEKHCDRIFMEKVSGKNIKDRPQMQELLNFIREGDTFCALEMSRVGRNLQDILFIIDFLLEKGVKVDIGGLGVIEKDSFTQRLVVQILGVIAEFQRNYIRESQRQGIEKAKERGVYKRPKITAIKRISLLEVINQLKNGNSVRRTAKNIGVSPVTLYSFMRIKENASKILAINEIKNERLKEWLKNQLQNQK